MKRIIISTICMLGAVFFATAQDIRLSLSALPEKTVKIYYYQGEKRDSLIVKLDKQGQATTRLPEGYIGMLQVLEPQTGSFVECIGGEPVLQIVGSEEPFRKENVQFPGSKENEFLYSTFEQKSEIGQKQGWLEAGLAMYGKQPANKQLTQFLTTEKKAADNSMAALNKQIQSSPLYAAGFLQIAEFLNDLFAAENRHDTVKIREVKYYIHHRMNWKQLYTSGQLWGSVQNYYLSMFNKEEPNLAVEIKQLRYATDIAPLFATVEEPIRSALLESVAYECDRFGWDLARDSISSYIAIHQIQVNTQNTSLLRIMEGYKTRPGEAAPNLLSEARTYNLSEPFNNPQRKGTATLLVFYESGCSNCERELGELQAQYVDLYLKGVRVISLSADRDSEVFAYHSKKFPWPDKLCDLKGFEGSNFVNYGIIGTPIFYLIDTNGIIKCRYARLADVRHYIESDEMSHLQQ